MFVEDLVEAIDDIERGGGISRLGHSRCSSVEWARGKDTRATGTVTTGLPAEGRRASVETCQRGQMSLISEHVTLAIRPAFPTPSGTFPHLVPSIRMRRSRGPEPPPRPERAEAPPPEAGRRAARANSRR